MLGRSYVFDRMIMLGTKYCGAMLNEHGVTWYCTERHKGHDGEHVAGTGAPEGEMITPTSTGAIAKRWGP